MLHIAGLAPHQLFRRVPLRIAALRMVVKRVFCAFLDKAAPCAAVWLVKCCLAYKSQAHNNEKNDDLLVVYILLCAWSSDTGEV